MQRLVDAIRLEFGVDGLREAGFGETDRLGAFDSKKFLQIRCCEMLHHGVIFEIQQDFRPDTFRNILGDQHKMQLALVVTQLLAANDQDPRPQNEGKQSLRRSGWKRVVHCGDSMICRADIPVCWYWGLSSRRYGHGHGTGKSREPAGWKACATSRSGSAPGLALFVLTPP